LYGKREQPGVLTEKDPRFESLSLALNRLKRERRNTMPLIQLVLVLVVVGVVLWVINSYIPMQSTIKRILNVVVVIVVILWLLSVFGLIGNLGDLSKIRVGK
jgi:Flp pilus assembly protein TadB